MQCNKKDSMNEGALTHRKELLNEIKEYANRNKEITDMFLVDDLN